MAPPSAPAPAGLGYGEPEINPATYAFSDTSTFSIEAPGYGVMEVESAQLGIAELHFRPAAHGYDVEVRLPRFQGSFRNADQGITRADESDIGGPVGVSLSFTGRMTVVDTPAVSQAFLDVTGAESMVRPLFVRLPGRAIAPGGRWVDTVRTRDQSAETVSTGSSVITATLLGDTVLDDRRLLRIGTETVASVEVSGVSGGAVMEQRLRGVLRGHVLWDEQARVLVERVDEGELVGTLDLPGSGITPLPVSATVRRRVSLLR